MMALTLGVLLLLMMVLAVRVAASAPLFRTIGAAIDSWADGVQGRESEPF